ncbi:MAG: hypothetical protein AAFX99_33395 [Myxococcota bacterium]
MAIHDTLPLDRQEVLWRSAKACFSLKARLATSQNTFWRQMSMGVSPGTS